MRLLSDIGFDCVFFYSEGVIVIFKYKVKVVIKYFNLL